MVNTWGCSLGAILPGKMADGKTYVLRNYDLSPDISDMRLCTTRVEGSMLIQDFQFQHLVEVKV